MARKPNDVELIITARNESKKAFQSVVDTMKEIETAAKKGGGLTELFKGYEQRIAGITAKQKQFNDLLGDTKAAQKAIKSAEKFTQVVKAQEDAVVRAEKELSGLESTYSDLEKAANAARSPNEKLGLSLAAQEAKQASLATAINETREAIVKANKALTDNVNIDAKSSAAIDKQSRKVAESGKAWRDTTAAISSARKEINALSSQRNSLQDALTGPSKKSALEQELKTLKEFIKESARLQRAGGIGDATKSLTADAKNRISQVEAMLKSERQIQAQLNNDLSKTTAELRRQETALGSLVTKGAAQKKVYLDLKNALVEFTNAQRSQGNDRQQANIDKLNTSLKSLEANYEATAAKIASTQAALSKSSGPDPKSVAQFNALKIQIEGARAAIDKERAELVDLQTQLKSAGISTETLAQRQRELDSVTQKLTQEESKLADQLKIIEAQAGRTGTKVNQTGNAFLKMGDDSRKSLSYMQRIRGELLAIASTYVGVFAIGGAIKSIYDESVNLNKATARFSVFFNGDQKKVAEEIDFVTKSAKDLKIEVAGALDQYSKFVSGLDQSQIPLKQVRAVFTGFSTAARVGRLSGEELERVFNAVSQIFGKQQLQTEELKGQLADALPGAVKRTADALKLGEDGVKKLTKALNDGNVSSEAAILLADELYKVYGAQLPQALKGPDAALADFKNTVRDLKLEIANSGFIETLTEALKEATKTIGSGEFKKGAKDIAAALGEIIKLVPILLRNFDNIKLALEVALGLKALSILNAFRVSIVATATGMAAFSASVATAAPALGGIIASFATFLSQLVSLPVILAGLAGYGIGTWLQNEFRPVKKFGVLIVASLDLLVIRARQAFDTLKAYATKNGDALSKSLEEIATRTAIAVQASKEAIDSMFDEIDKTDGRKFNNKKSVFIDVEQAKKDADAVKALYGGIAQEKQKSLFTKEETDELIKKALSGSSDKQNEKIAKLRETIGDELAKIDAEIQEKSADTLDQRLASIKVQYEKLLRDVAKAGGDKAFPNAKSSIDQISAIKQVEETEKEINRLVQERRTLIANINEQSELGAITVEEATKRINEANARILPSMTEALAKAREISNSINSKPITQNVDNQSELVDLETQRAKKEQLLAIEQRINNEMDLRRDRIQTINALVQTGVKSEADAKREILDLNAQTSQQLDGIINQAIILADKLGDRGAIERLAQTKIELEGVKEKIIDASDVNDSFASGLTDAWTGFIQGTMSAKEAFSSFISSFLVEIASAITKALILKAITGSIGGGSGGIGGALAGAVNHTGGIVGMTARKRTVPIAAFAGASRYHTGGIAGLKSNEVPSILEKGEEVLTRNDPRHMLNNGGGGSGGSQQSIKIINAIDSASVMNEALNSAAGQKVLVNAIRAQKSSIKSVLS